MHRDIPSPSATLYNPCRSVHPLLSALCNCHFATMTLNLDFSSGFALPSMANGSTTSLMDAVVGGSHSTGNTATRQHQPFSDASRRVNEKPESAEDVQELERKLEKR